MRIKYNQPRRDDTMATATATYKDWLEDVIAARSAICRVDG